MLLLSVAIVFATVAGFATWRTGQIHDLASARDEALNVGRERISLLLSYRHTTLDEDLATALGQTTGAFTEEFRTLLDDVVRDTATDRRITTQASVNAAGVVSTKNDEVVLLIFLTQSTTSRNSPDPVVSGSRVDVTMQRVGSTWKIAGLETK